jgi:HTH-type transcriptional regulator/antitoxin HigA
MSNEKFQAGIAIPPGETLKEVLDDQNITQKELALRLGVTPKHINKVINGSATISPDIALKLESVLGLPANFWNKLEMDYQETKARLRELPQLDEELWITQQIPYNEAANLGWLPHTNDKREKVKNLRSLFRVASLDNLSLVENALFRKSEAFRTNEYALALWMNQAEHLASEIDVDPYSSAGLNSVLPSLRKLTNKPFKASKLDLVKICASVGIALVFIPTIPGTHINGVTKWLTTNKVMVAMSAKGVYEDIFWFSFFHEIGHVLKEKKSIIFIDEEESIEIDDLEVDADNFSTDFLIPIDQYTSFISNSNYKEIMNIRNFSENINVHIGIVIGRLLHDNLISYDSIQYKSFEQLRRKFKI